MQIGSLANREGGRAVKSPHACRPKIGSGARGRWRAAPPSPGLIGTYSRRMVLLQRVQVGVGLQYALIDRNTVAITDAESAHPDPNPSRCVARCPGAHGTRQAAGLVAADARTAALRDPGETAAGTRFHGHGTVAGLACLAACAIMELCRACTAARQFGSGQWRN